MREVRGHEHESGTAAGERQQVCGSWRVAVDNWTCGAVDVWHGEQWKRDGAGAWMSIDACSETTLDTDDSIAS